MNPLEWIAGGGILSVVIFSIATYVRTDKQISRVYERLDEKTEKLEQETVQQKVCDIVQRLKQRQKRRRKLLMITASQ